ncbi:MAG: peptide chain release factor N(5)-glutamine methyltransferase [Actinomycetota bacterium]|nr:peptide chain release factor N(5)-glutamine methyltransferase [Actinomycetota bacterium]
MYPEPTTIAQLLHLGERVLSDSSHIFDDHDNQREAEDLMAFCLKTKRSQLKRRAPVPARTRDRYLALVARRAGGEPFPFLVGGTTFFGLHMEVRPGAFVPRPSSELAVIRSLTRLKGRREPVVVDVCTGAGPIALAIAHERPNSEVWGSDISEDGLRVARLNARKLGIDNVTFRRGDMYDALPTELRGEADLIVGHVPYVAPHELDDLPAEVREFEPVFTLMGDSVDGFELMRRAVAEGTEWLKPGGWMLLELADDLAPKVRRLTRKAGLEDHGVGADDDHLTVIVEARKPPE